MTPLRLLVYDRTCVNPAGVGLSNAWRAGAHLYRSLGRLDACFGASSWSEALGFVRDTARRLERPIQQIQYWGHGRRGRALIDRDVLDRHALGSSLRPLLDEIRALCTRIDDEPLLWFRTCESLGGHSGHDFAHALGEYFGRSIAGHTYVIGFWQSGLHSLAPGKTPHWSAREGLRDDDESAVALPSSPALPHTIQCLQGRVPPGW